MPITIMAILYSVVALFFSFWPQTAQVQPAGMNYSILIFGVALLFSWGFWAVYGRKVYVGPIWEFEGEFVRVN